MKVATYKGNLVIKEKKHQHDKKKFDGHRILGLIMPLIIQKGLQSPTATSDDSQLVMAWDPDYAD